MAFKKPMPQPRRYITLTRLILERLAEFGEVAIGSFFPAKYPEARLWRELLGLDSGYRFHRESFSAILSRLQSQGLVVRSGARQKSHWRITPLGHSYIAAGAAGPAPAMRTDGIRRLVIFDIPERDRKKRDAIRLELVAAGFTQLQKSVWSGERPLPKDFLELVDALNLKRYLHILSVRDAGTLH